MASRFARSKIRVKTVDEKVLQIPRKFEFRDHLLAGGALRTNVFEYLPECPSRDDPSVGLLVPTYNQHIRLLSPEPWLVGTTKVYSGVGAGVVMESITLIDDYASMRRS